MFLCVEFFLKEILYLDISVIYKGLVRWRELEN